MIYADPSFLCSLYGRDANTPRAEAVYRADARRPLFLTPWQRFEVRNAIRLMAHKLRAARLPVPFQPGNIFKRMDEDLAAGRLKHEQPDWLATFRLAEELSAKHTVALGTAAVDLCHLASAIVLEADSFWTFDEVQFEAAKATGKFRKLPFLTA